MTLAYELSHKGYKVTIIEKNSDWGGLASGLKIGDTYLEKYYHHWFRSDHDIQELIKELGLEYKMYFPASSMGIYIDGELHSFSGSIDLLKFKPLNIFNRLRAVSYHSIFQNPNIRKVTKKSKQSIGRENISASRQLRSYGNHFLLGNLAKSTRIFL